MTIAAGMEAALGHVMIRASAGTGKTFQLSNRFLRLLLSGVPVDQILATTFTRKAAGEILDRVILRCPAVR
jgi:ATP-dependent helicase/nuclease subunit A